MCLKVLKNGAWIEDPPPSPASFFSASLTDFVGSRVTAQKNVPVRESTIQKYSYNVYYFQNEYWVCQW